MSDMTSVEQKALAIAEIAARLVQASVDTNNVSSMETVLTKFSTAYASVKRTVNFEVDGSKR